MPPETRPDDHARTRPAAGTGVDPQGAPDPRAAHRLPARDPAREPPAPRERGRHEQRPPRRGRPIELRILATPGIVRVEVEVEDRGPGFEPDLDFVDAERHSGWGCSSWTGSPRDGAWPRPGPRPCGSSSIGEPPSRRERRGVWRPERPGTTVWSATSGHRPMVQPRLTVRSGAPLSPPCSPDRTSTTR